MQSAALRNWSLLLTTVPAGQLDSDFVEANIKVLAALLHSDDVEVGGAGRVEPAGGDWAGAASWWVLHSYKLEAQPWVLIEHR